MFWKRKVHLSRYEERYLHEIVAQRETHDDQTRGIVGWFYRFYKRETVNFVKNTAGSVLEVGCGDGTLFQHTNITPFGLDISLTRLRRAKRFRDLLVCADAYALPFKDATFDSVLLVALLEHTNEPRKILVDSHRVLKADGDLVIVIPNDILMSIGRVLLGKWPPRYPDHLTFITPKRLRRWTKGYFSVSIAYPLVFKKLSFYINLYYFTIMKKLPTASTGAHV